MSDRNSPAKASSVWPEMPFMRGPEGAERLREWLPQLRQIRAQTAARRERVLRHEWARARLCHILTLTDAKKWNGYVPPATNEHGQRNDSGIRRALVELLRDVERAESGEAEAE